MSIGTSPRDRVLAAVHRGRLLETAVRLVSIPSPTGDAGRAADCLAGLLGEAGLEVERRDAGHPAAPAVIARLRGGGPGPTLQMDGHLDTVHLPFVPPRVEGDLLRGSGACDMKGGLAAAVEALRALKDSGALRRGAVLLTAHDLHEAPWGSGEQLDRLIGEGLRGDGVLIPEPLCDRLPVAGRGAATWKVAVRRPGPPVHEVMRPEGEPSVIAAGAELIRRLGRLDEELARKRDPLAGRESAFVGQVHSGEIYNGFPRECLLEGTRRWLPGTSPGEAESGFRAVTDALARDTGTMVETTYRVIRGAFALDLEAPLVAAFRRACEGAGFRPPEPGPKPFVDDGNSFWSLARVPAITHGPRAGGQHTLEEWVSIDDLVRVARAYALAALELSELSDAAGEAP
ncbi:MAG: M20/M25/M40 family metallo-hydrolase [Planctomycetes bacterium]|nr:M20/M25/M40 family metallo-hydrolase [Planctomycetota bacterium]